MFNENIGMNVLLSELGKVETHNLANIEESVIVEDIMDILSECDELSDNIFYPNEEMVPIIKVNGTYLVEHYNLINLMEGHKYRFGIYDEIYSLQKLAEFHDIKLDDIAVVVENEQSYKKTIAVLTAKLRFEQNPLKKNLLRSQLAQAKAKLIKFKQKGVKMIKKPSTKEEDVDSQK